MFVKLSAMRVLLEVGKPWVSCSTRYLLLSIVFYLRIALANLQRQKQHETDSYKGKKTLIKINTNSTKSIPQQNKPNAH